MKSIAEHVFAIQQFYPRIYHACHVSHKAGKQSEIPVSEREASILSHLSNDYIISATELARHLNISKATLSEALAKLIDKGCVKVKTDQDDSRRQLLSLTETGMQAVAQGSVLDGNKLSMILDRLSLDDRNKVVEGLELLAKAAMEIQE